MATAVLDEEAVEPVEEKPPPADKAKDKEPDSEETEAPATATTQQKLISTRKR